MSLLPAPTRRARAWTETVAIEADDPFCPVKSNRLTGPLPPKPLENSGIFTLVEILHTIRCTMRSCSFVRLPARRKPSRRWIHSGRQVKGEHAAREQEVYMVA